jgi:hypothetical protein
MLGTLNEICDDLEDDLEFRSYAIVGTIAAAGNEIQESMLKLYISNVPLDKESVNDHLACFSGMEILDILCDCGTNTTHCMKAAVESRPFFQIGKDYKKNETVQYSDAELHVSSLRRTLDNMN